MNTAKAGDIITLTHPRANYSERHLVIAVRTSRNGAIAYMVAQLRNDGWRSIPAQSRLISNVEKSDNAILMNAINRHIARLKHWCGVRDMSKPAFSILNTRGYAHDGTYHAVPDVDVIEGDDTLHKIACATIKMYNQKLTVLIDKINDYLNNETMKASA